MLATVVALGLAGCSGKDTQENKPSGPDRSSFVEVTDAGLAAVIDKHLGDRVKSYAAYSDQDDAGGKDTVRTVVVTLEGADPRDTFEVSVYPSGGSQGQVVIGSCAENGAPADPQAKTTCHPAPQGGNVTITQFSFGLADGNQKGSYLTASGSGPEEREATVAYESFSKKMPLTHKDLDALLGDPYLGWETDPKFNSAGDALTIGNADE